MLCAPGSHYLSVKTNKGEIIAIIGSAVKDAGWMTPDQAGCNALTPNLRFEHP